MRVVRSNWVPASGERLRIGNEVDGEMLRRVLAVVPG